MPRTGQAADRIWRITTPDPPTKSQCPVEWCLFGRLTGEYIFECARDPIDLVDKYGRVPGDGTRIIRIVGSDMQHPHNSDGCVPVHVLYRSSSSARKAASVISRSLVAGESVHIL